MRVKNLKCSSNLKFCTYQKSDQIATQYSSFVVRGAFNQEQESCNNLMKQTVFNRCKNSSLVAKIKQQRVNNSDRGGSRKSFNGGGGG